MLPETLNSEVPIKKDNVTEQGQVLIDPQMKLPVDAEAVLLAVMRHLFTESSVSSQMAKNRQDQQQVYLFCT